MRLSSFNFRIAIDACARAFFVRTRYAPNKLKYLAKIALGFAALSLAAQAHSEDEDKDPLKIGFIYVGPVEDLGWTYRHDEARKAILDIYGDRVETTYIENVPEGAGATEALTDLAETGHDLIFATSFGFMDAVNEVAASYPGVKFEHATGYRRDSDNVATFSARFYEGRAIQGLIAANLTETNKIGYIASFPIPEVIRGINAFMLEAQKHNPDIEVEIIWVFSWFDPAKEAAAANTLIDGGADIIVQHTDSPAAMQVAETRGVRGFGQASDMSRFGPNAHLFSIVDNWDSYYIDRVGAALDGTWSGGADADTWWGLTKDGQGGEAGMVEIASYNENIPDDVLAQAKALETALATGARHAFPCEGLLKNDGSQPKECADGAEHLQDFPTLLTMDWYIQGIDAQIPD